MNKIKFGFLSLSILSVSAAFNSCDKEEDGTPSNQINGHEYVDLGLSVKWATCNVGATSVTDYGKYYSWGEDLVKTTFNWSTYDEDLEYVDVATKQWGSTWRIPTAKEQSELVDNCTWSWQTNYKGSGVNGQLGTSKKNGNTIFLPASGYFSEAANKVKGSDGHYWSSDDVDGYSGDYAYCLYFKSDKVDYNGKSYLYHGFTVRPVSK